MITKQDTHGRLRRAISGIACGCAVPICVAAQSPVAGPAPAAGFSGHVVSRVDSMPIYGAEIRLLFVDSSHVANARAASPTVEYFVDSAHVRLGLSDSLGAFAIRGLAAGSYVFQVRRLGFAPLEGRMTVDTGILRVRIPIEPTVQLLAGMTVTEAAEDANKKYLDRSGFSVRSRGGFVSSVVTRNEIDARHWWSVGDYLLSQTISDAVILLDGLGMSFTDVRTYPMDRVLAIEVYRGTLPLDLENMWPGLRRTSSGHLPGRDRPRVIIWSLTR